MRSLDRARFSFHCESVDAHGAGAGACPDTQCVANTQRMNSYLRRIKRRRALMHLGVDQAHQPAQFASRGLDLLGFARVLGLDQSSESVKGGHGFGSALPAARGSIGCRARRPLPDLDRRQSAAVVAGGLQTAAHGVQADEGRRIEMTLPQNNEL